MKQFLDALFKLKEIQYRVWILTQVCDISVKKTTFLYVKKSTILIEMWVALISFVRKKNLAYILC